MEYFEERSLMAPKSHSNVSTADRLDVCASSRTPSFTTRLGAFQKSNVFSAPVRLQTINGSPVSCVRSSHSPFGPCMPGPHDAGDTNILAPSNLMALAIFDV